MATIGQGSVPDVALPGPPTTGSVPAIAAPVPRPEAGPTAPPPRHPFTWDGSPWALAGTCIRNAALSVLTLGIYSFWGRTEIRKRLWSSVRLLGEPLGYHGTPRELLRGFFLVLAVVLIPLFLLGLLVSLGFGGSSAIAATYQIGLFAVLYPILTAVAFYRGRRYRLARTSWRGIRSSLTGSSTAYAALSWLTMAAVPFTLFWLLPYRAVALQRALVSDMSLGNARLSFEGSAGPVYKRYALLWFSTIALSLGSLAIAAWIIGSRYQSSNPLWWTTLQSRDVLTVIAVVVGATVIWSLISSFYYARLYSYLAHATLLTPSIPGALPLRFQLDVTGKRIMWLFVTNALITYFSLYILKPVAQARTMKYYAEHLSIVGPFEPSAIGQNTTMFNPSGEGLAQAFDLDAF